MLVPGGTLILLEISKEQAWHEVTTGLLQGWQKAEDVLQQPRTLLEVEEWKLLFELWDLKKWLQCLSQDHRPKPSVCTSFSPETPRAQAEISATNVSVVDDVWKSSQAVERVNISAEAEIFANAFQQAPPAERHTLVIDLVSRQIAQILQLESGALPRKRDRLVDLGMDSLMAVELRNRLSTILSWTICLQH